MKTKNNSQKIVSAKILAKLVEQANKYVVPFVKINAPGKYTAKEMATEVDSLGNKLFYKFDYDNSEVQELVVRIADDDFSQSELAELGFSPKIKLTLICEKVFLAIAKYERLAGIKLANVAKFVVGEPETLYETERAKVVLFDYAKQKIVTKTKTLTIISDCLAIYLNKKDYYAFCLKINGKWINVLNRVGYFDLAETIERAKKIITYKSTKSGAETYIAQKADAYADFARMILEEFRAMEQSNEAETADNAKPTAEAKESAETQSTAECDKCGGDDGRKQADAPQNKESAPPEQSKREKPRGRKSAVLSDFRSKGDKVYRQSGKNRNMGIYCGKNEVLSAEVRGSSQKRSDKQHT